MQKQGAVEAKIWYVVASISLLYDSGMSLNFGATGVTPSMCRSVYVASAPRWLLDRTLVEPFLPRERFGTAKSFVAGPVSSHIVPFFAFIPMAKVPMRRLSFHAACTWDTSGFGDEGRNMPGAGRAKRW